MFSTLLSNPSRSYACTSILRETGMLYYDKALEKNDNPIFLVKLLDLQYT